MSPSTAMKICGVISLSVSVNLTISGCAVSPSIASSRGVPRYTKRTSFIQGGENIYHIHMQGSFYSQNAQAAYIGMFTAYAKSLEPKL